jgi:ribonuclease BN (tRNA processing enzyme)
MNLIILGCGTIIQNEFARNCSGYLLDKKILLDCGPGVWKALHHHKIPIADIEVISFTHFHVDHTSDLAPFLQEKYLTNENPAEQLTIIGPHGLVNWYEKLATQIGAWSQEMNIKIIETENKPTNHRKYTIETMATPHSDNSICYRIEKNKTRFFYSGDTDYNERMQSIVWGSDLAILEASNLEETKVKGHLTPGLAGKLAALSRIKKLLLTHMYPEVRLANPMGKAAEYYDGPIILAEDGMEIEF